MPLRNLSFEGSKTQGFFLDFSNIQDQNNNFPEYFSSRLNASNIGKIPTGLGQVSDPFNLQHSGIFPQPLDSN